MKISYLSILLISFFLSFASCNKEDKEPVYGGWESMRWKIENIGGDISIKSFSSSLYIKIEGEGSFDAVCENYDHFWITPPEGKPGESMRVEEYEYEGVKLSVDGRILHCEIDNSSEEYMPAVSFIISNGEVSSYFDFYREDLKLDF